MFRPVRRSLEAACKLGFLEYLVRVSTSEEEVVASARTLSGRLAGKVVEIRQSFQREIFHLEDKVSLYDIETMTEASAAVVMLELNGAKLIRKVIEPEAGERWPLLYLLATNDYMCLLYTPEMTYLDKYDPITGKAKETLVSPMLMDTYRNGLYQNRTRKTIAVQTDIQLTDSFEVSDDGEETKTANLASKSLFVPFLRRTIMKEKNREIEFERKSEGPPLSSPGKVDIKQIIAEKSAGGRVSSGSTGLFGVLRAATSLKPAEKGTQDTPLTTRTSKSGEAPLKDDPELPVTKEKQDSQASKASSKGQETRKSALFSETKGKESAPVHPHIQEVPLRQEQSEPQSPQALPKAPSQSASHKPQSSAGSSIFGGERNPAKNRPEAAGQSAAKTEPGNSALPPSVPTVQRQGYREEAKVITKAPVLDSSEEEDSSDQMRETAKPLSPPAEIVEIKAGKQSKVQAAVEDSPPQVYEDVYEEHKDFSHVASRFEKNPNLLNENESLQGDSEEEYQPAPRKSSTKLNIIPPADSEPHKDDEEDENQQDYDEEEEEYDVYEGHDSPRAEGKTKENPKKATPKGDSDDEDFKPTVKVPSKARDDCQCVLQ